MIGQGVASIRSRRFHSRKLRTLGLLLLLRAPVEFPPAQDAGIGDSGDREVGELP